MKIIIDKLPLSIIELGFIKIIFPNSKIILQCVIHVMLSQAVFLRLSKLMTQ